MSGRVACSCMSPQAALEASVRPAQVDMTKTDLELFQACQLRTLTAGLSCFSRLVTSTLLTRSGQRPWLLDCC